MNITEEPSTLVYTLLDHSTLPFEHFSLIVRSLHSYMVEEITPNEESKCMYVKLGYQASIKNATAKLGKLVTDISITKSSSHVDASELSLLDKLKKQYGFGGPAEEAATSRPIAKKARSYLPSANVLEEYPESQYE